MNKQFILIILIFLGFNSILQAQVGINTETPDPSAYLEIKGNSGGFLPPRLSNTDRDGVLKTKGPANGLLIYNIDEQTLQQNVGTSISPKWVNIGANQTNTSSVDWFYLPPVALNLSTPEPVNLYTVYKNQLTTPASAPSGASALKVYAANELEFYVLGYDKNLFGSVTIDATGNLTYVVPDATKQTAQSYLTVIAKIKAK